jgi:alkanesulfonate monooxygenase SsuD/methylene tetrahydromethanopterin reductase-like flavin-dependent oxidoreductase (luciferase family)
MSAIASAATSVVIAHVAANTEHIRLGAGGVMLPNHSPLVIAEQFGTLTALHPGRIDLGLGRAPGSDQATMRAPRRTPSSAGTPEQAQTYLEQLTEKTGADELMLAPASPNRDERIRAVELIKAPVEAAAYW